MPDYSAVYKGLSSIGDAFEKYQDEQKNNAKKFKSLVGYAQASGIMPKEQAEVLGVDELEGAVQGAMMKKKIEADTQLAAKREQEQQLMREELIEINRKRQGQDAMVNVMRGMGQLPVNETLALGQGPVNPPKTAITPETIMRSASQNPNWINAPNAGQLPDLMRQMRVDGSQSQNDIPPELANLGPNKIPVIWKKGSGTFTIDPGYGAEVKLDAQKELAQVKESLKGLPEGAIIKRENGVLVARTKDGKILDWKTQGARDAIIFKALEDEANNPKDSDIQYLKKHPASKAGFEKRFGAGSAAEHLK